MAVRQNTVRKSATAGGAASCRAAFGVVWLLPLLGGRSFGGGRFLAAKDAEERKESAGHGPSFCRQVSTSSYRPYHRDR